MLFSRPMLSATALFWGHTAARLSCMSASAQDSLYQPAAVRSDALQHLYCPIPLDEDGTANSHRLRDVTESDSTHADDSFTSERQGSELTCYLAEGVTHSCSDTIGAAGPTINGGVLTVADPGSKQNGDCPIGEHSPDQSESRTDGGGWQGRSYTY